MKRNVPGVGCRVLRRIMVVLAGALLLSGCNKTESQTSAIAALTATQEQSIWQTDYDAALKQAAAENKYVLVNISGMDWCHYCQALEKEVFSQPEFLDYAKANLVCVQLDFDFSGRSSNQQFAAQHEALLARFMVEGFPTVIILNPQGRAVARDGYRFGGAKPYVEMIQKLIADSAGK